MMPNQPNRCPLCGQALSLFVHNDFVIFWCENEDCPYFETYDRKLADFQDSTVGDLRTLSKVVKT